jgi:tRNA nucleotidyltransferase/poly(A) polymerase
MILTNAEKSLFAKLRTIAVDNAVVARAAGGCVRDKLMGLESHDIDIAVEGMSGREFAELVRAKHGGNIHVIEARPEQSKHLETAQVTIDGQLVDFVGLRTEVYGDSRIPEIRPATPFEDAMRRDLTINAMFFNINNGCIEDHTGMGRYDLEHRIARTPLGPWKTFQDDPLRILRVIRFCARFDLDPTDEVVIAAQNPNIQSAFLQKISRERIWAEMVGAAEPNGWKRGFLNGPDPYYALTLINTFGFRDLLFYPEDEGLEPWDREQNNIYHDLNVWEHTNLALRFLIEELPKPENPEDEAMRILALLFHDLGKLDPKFTQIHPDGEHWQFKKHEVRSFDLAKKQLEWLTAPAKFTERCCRLVKFHGRFQDDLNNRSLRRTLRDMGDDWEHLLDIAFADGNGKKRTFKKRPVREMFMGLRERFKKIIEDQAGVTTIVRPINGNDLMELGIKPGPKMGEIFKALDEELLDKPLMTREEALELARNIERKAKE